MTTTEGAWLSITDYSNYKKVSVSTIRRHIRSNILRYKEENGKYYIYTPSIDKIRNKEREEVFRLKLDNEFLKNKLRLAEEEINELRMLVGAYESQGKVNQKEDLPPEWMGTP